MHPPPPHEPEIEFLGKIARGGLFAFRTATAVAALIGITYAVVNMFDPPVIDPEHEALSEMAPITPYFVWFCCGLPALVPTDWLFGRGRWPMLVLGFALWLGPMWLPGDSDYGYIVRFFASLVAISVLLVWRTVFALTPKSPAPPHVGN